MYEKCQLELSAPCGSPTFRSVTIENEMGGTEKNVKLRLDGRNMLMTYEDDAGYRKGNFWEYMARPEKE
jgi:hypothetical protein